jgi:hypothetical protein
MHPGESTGPPGTVIRFDRRNRRRTTTITATPPAPHAERTPEQLLAETMEALFLQHGHTLSDESTAEIYRTTLDALQMMLDGSKATGKVGDDEHEFLSGMVQGMRSSPDEL